MNDDDEEEDESDDIEEISVEDAFEELSEGRDRVTLDAVCQWHVVKELLDEGIITSDMLTQFAIKVCKAPNSFYFMKRQSIQVEEVL